MILVDLNQVMISNLVEQMKISKTTQVDENFVRHMILNSIRSYRNKFYREYGELVICCDDRNYWRKDIFPYYKAHRKKDREKSDLDWNEIFRVLNGIRDDLRDFFPYKVLKIECAEADDIIAAMVKRFPDRKILILSSDKDFAQLQCYGNVEQYSPMQKKKITHKNPFEYIKKHIIRGDRGDGIPNFLSEDDCLVLGKRQKSIMTKRLDEWLKFEHPEEFCDEKMLYGYRRNEALVDLSKIPKWIHDKVADMYDNYEDNDRSLMMNYFIKNKLKHLMGSLQEF